MSLAGKTICFTGALETKRADAKKQAEDAGATVASSVTSKVQILVCGAGAGAKMEDAKAKGVEVWTEQEFIDALGGSGGAPAAAKKKAAAVPDPPSSKKAKVAASPSKKIASTVVTSTTADGDGGGGATADPDAVTAMSAEGLINNVEVTAHHKLVQIEVATNTDKYFVMQILKGETAKKETKHLVFTRWGRTGTKGQVKCEGPYDEAEQAAADIAAKFKEKTGNEISAVADGSFTLKPKKYDLVVGDTGKEVSIVGKDGGCLWQYWVDDGVDGKVPGWYDYTADAAQIVEGVYSEWKNNPALDVRCVQSGTWCYKVDFNSMDQTNVSHPARRMRHIRRNA